MEMMVNYNLIFAENQRLDTERLLLRPVTLLDAEDMFEYGSDEETVAYVFPLHQQLEDTRIAIANYFMCDPLGKYGVELKETGKMIGTIDLRVDAPNKIAEIGYSLNKNYWGQGIMPEASKALLKLGFEEMNLLRIFSRHDEENPKSGRVMEKIGMKKEGRIVNARIAKGKVVTDILRGITIDEWKKQQIKGR